MSKYRSVKTVVDGITFASKKEANRFSELMMLQRGGRIEGLRCQVPYEFRVNGKLMFTYLADFTYIDLENWKKGLIVEDVKGFKTPVYRLKKKIIEAVYGIEIKEV